MYHNDPIFINAELEYRRERALVRATGWERERPRPVREHPHRVREALGRWWHRAVHDSQQAGTLTAVSEQAIGAPRRQDEATREPAAAPGGHVTEGAEARQHEHTAA